MEQVREWVGPHVQDRHQEWECNGETVQSCSFLVHLLVEEAYSRDIIADTLGGFEVKSQVGEEIADRRRGGDQ